MALYDIEIDRRYSFNLNSSANSGARSSYWSSWPVSVYIWLTEQSSCICPSINTSYVINIERNPCQFWKKETAAQVKGKLICYSERIYTVCMNHFIAATLDTLSMLLFCVLARSFIKFIDNNVKYQREQFQELSHRKHRKANPKPQLTTNVGHEIHYLWNQQNELWKRGSRSYIASVYYCVEFWFSGELNKESYV